MCTPRFIATSFIIANIQKQPQYPSTTEWIKKISYVCIHIVRYGVRVGEFQKKNQTGTL